MKTILVLVMALGFTGAAWAQTGPQSVYTSLNIQDCLTVESVMLLPEEEREIDYYTGVCPSYGGYTVGVSGGDLRYSLFLSYNGTEISLPSYYQFHETGNLAEWRYALKSTGFHSNELQLKALIYRIYYSDYDTNGNEVNKSNLIVVRLNKEKSCVIGIVPQQKDMNLAARKIADNPKARCVKIN
ncbi:MAG: hypothetical protein M9899_04140 [Bdellovibrionaceae bacterium]|nr:hypothetical protein [Pseudobdellovibrionaceae bacterium]